MGRTADVDGFLDNISAQQFDEWLAEFCIQPWDSKLADLHAALLACTVRNTWGGDGHGRPAQMENYMMFAQGFHSEAEREQTDEEIVEVAKRFALATGGRVKE